MPSLPPVKDAQATAIDMGTISLHMLAQTAPTQRDANQSPFDPRPRASHMRVHEPELAPGTWTRRVSYAFYAVPHAAIGTTRSKYRECLASFREGDRTAAG